MRKLTSIGLSLIVSLLMITSSLVTAWADEKPRLIDNADLLTASEESEINALLDSFRADNDFDVVVLTTREGLEDPELTARADDYYDYEGYGCGENKDGCLLLIDMESRMMHVSTTGYGITVLTDYGIDMLTDEVASYLGEEDYAGAIETGFLGNLEWMYEDAENGEPYDVPEETALDIKNPVVHIAILGLALLIGTACGAVVTSAKKKKLISVRKARGAASFMKKDSLRLTKQNDYFLYSTVVATPKPEDSSGSGGSSTHIGSSGTTHGGGSKGF